MVVCNQEAKKLLNYLNTLSLQGEMIVHPFPLLSHEWKYTSYLSISGNLVWAKFLLQMLDLYQLVSLYKFFRRPPIEQLSSTTQHVR